MAYRFYPRADAGQDKMWRDTVETWDEKHAVTYVTGLHTHLQRLCEKKPFGGSSRNALQLLPM